MGSIRVTRSRLQAGIALRGETHLERAQSVKALLEGDVDTWLSRYQTAASSSGRWGSAEGT
jgi:hypothetical protein